MLPWPQGHRLLVRLQRLPRALAGRSVPEGPSRRGLVVAAAVLAAAPPPLRPPVGWASPRWLRLVVMVRPPKRTRQWRQRPGGPGRRSQGGVAAAPGVLVKVVHRG
jgi:hypothetical protein